MTIHVLAGPLVSAWGRGAGSHW